MARKTIGKLFSEVGVKARHKGKTKKQISQMYRDLAYRKHAKAKAAELSTP